MLLPLVVFILLEVSTRWCVSAAELDQDVDYYKRLYDFGLGKRAAYSYVSEYKRLPVYNFGLGKRAGENRKMFNFGLGKRDYMDDDYDEDLKEDFEKRIKQYSFGLGKRLPTKSYSFGLGKRPEGKLYSFGLGKRSFDYNTPVEDYDFPEENKRDVNNNGHRFAFGLGKRELPEMMMEFRKLDMPDRPSRSMHYNFGLGKRSQPQDEKDARTSR